jgi:hypothetical protein
MDITKAFRFVFDDKQWISKVLIGVLMTVLGFLIIPALILQGYLVRIIRRVMGGLDNDLPEWDNFGDLLRDGFFVTVGQFLWFLPLILLLIVAGVTTGGFSSLVEGSDAAALIATGGGLLILCLTLLLVVAALFLTPALLIQYAIKGEFGAMFRFGEISDLIRNHMADILIVFLVTLVAGIAIGMVALIPCLGWVIALASGPYLTFVTGHLYGQIAGKVPGNKAGQLPTY